MAQSTEEPNSSNKWREFTEESQQAQNHSEETVRVEPADELKDAAATAKAAESESAAHGGPVDAERAELMAEVASSREKVMRALAELDNVRRRSEREVAN